MSLITPDGDPHELIDPSKWGEDGSVPVDEALKLVVQDAETAEDWIEQHYLSVRWVEADMMYQSPPVLKVWENTSVPRANISLFTVATHVNALLAQVTNGLFYEDPPFILRPRPSTSEDTVRAITAVQGYQLDQVNFREEVKRGLFSALLFGTGIWKWGWKIERKKRKKYVRRDEQPKVDAFGKEIRVPTQRSRQFDVIDVEEECSYPCFDNLDVRYALVDPGCRTGDIRDAKYVIHKQSMTYYDLCKLRDQALALGDESYDLPSEEEIRSWFNTPEAMDVNPGDDTTLAFQGSSPWLHHAMPRFECSTGDPLQEPLEVLERWDCGRVITVIQKLKVIRNVENPYGEIPFYSVNWWNISDAFWGIGLGANLSSEQRLQQGLTNAAADIASLIVNPLIVRSKGSNVTAQSIRTRLGGIVDVDGDVDKAFKYMEQPSIPSEIFAVGQQSEARAEAVSGANELLTMGNLPARGRTSIGRTATGASALSSASSTRIGSFVEDFNRQVFQPWLWKMHDLNCEYLPLDQLHQILNDELGQDFTLDEGDYLNASIAKFEVLAGAHLAVKAQMSQAITLMTQIFSSPQTMQELAQVNQKYVDVEQLLEMICDVSGWKNYYDIVKPLTPEMKQNMAANNPAVLQAQAKTQQQTQKHNDDLDLINQKSINRTVELAMREGMKKSMESEIVTGEPGTQGLAGGQ